MDRRTRNNLILFLRRFRKNYEFFLKNYSGKNAAMYLDQFTTDNIRLAQVLFGNRGANIVRYYLRKITAA